MDKKRRRILKVSAGALLSMPALALLAQPEAFGGLPMGVHGATLQKFPVAQIVKMLREDLQLRYLELTPSQIRLRAVAQGNNQGPAATVAAIRDLRTLLTDNDITPSAWGPIALNSSDADLRQLFELASELGVRNLTCITQAEHLDSLEKLADEYSMRIAVHNNAPGSSFSRISEVLAALNGRGANVGACLDIGNVLRASEDPAMALQALAGKIIGLHLKSVDRRDADSEVVELDEGLLDTDAFFRALKTVRLGSDPAVSLEYLAAPDQPLPGALRSLALVKTAMAG